MHGLFTSLSAMGQTRESERVPFRLSQPSRATMASAAQIPVTTTMETDAAQHVCCRGPSCLEHMSIAKAFVAMR